MVRARVVSWEHSVATLTGGTYLNADPTHGGPTNAELAASRQAPDQHLEQGIYVLIAGRLKGAVVVRVTRLVVALHAGIGLA